MSNNNRIQEIRNRRAVITPDWEYNGNEIVSSQNPRRGIGGFLTEEDNEFAENAPYDIDFLLSEYDRLREALEWYADKKTYETNLTDQWEPVTLIDQDLGERARAALSHLKG